MTITAILVLAAGTYAFRLTGPLLREKFRPGPRVTRLLAMAAAVLLVALAVTSALTQGHDLAGWARPAGVLVGGVLAWRKVPFLIVVVAAVATTAGLRLLGVH
ncbi:MAG TPA: AzlD domain-containing protein [Pseudonocardiaceae bacterium]|nr:AzlD domain-containing protein [Pseudonocardiaceae bacterium]